MEKVEKLIIIGSGPAGLTAAIYASRGKIDPLVITGSTPGGQLMITTDVEDFPGFPEGVQGPELMKLFRDQAERFGTKFIDESVVSVDLKVKPFMVQTESQRLLTETLIIATGASAQWLGLPSEQKLIGRGVSACAVCDAPFFKGKRVVIVGGGDTAMREAQHLSKFAETVTVIHRRGELRAQISLQEAVRAKSNVSFVLNSVVEEILGEEKVTGAKIKNIKTGEEKTIETDGIFIAIGNTPNTGFLKCQVDLDEAGYIVNKGESKTSVEGVFVAGDVADHRYRQAVTAAGAGCKAALDVEEYLLGI